jgi:hypothetical protein|tara:strand:+ start:1259 stop:1741 length:483 start_codon:yes stop_codon:yes gene_type:complete
MQTFLPYSDFEKSAKVLDWRRLGKQRVEGMQILNAIEQKPRKDGKPYKGWVNHPCSVMWKAYVPALKHYTNIIITEWINRGYNNNMKFYAVDDLVIPHWIGDERIHSSHRANLLRKDFEWYGQYGWDEGLKDVETAPYVWHDIEGKFYEQLIGTGVRNYL